MSENTTNQTEELELSTEQIKRVDQIHNAVLELCRVMAELPTLQYDMSFIGDIADYAASVLVEHRLPVRYPAIVTEEDGTQYIEDYVNGFNEDPGTPF